MTSLSSLDIDHLLRSKVANMLEELEDIEPLQYDSIERHLTEALTAINDELYELENEES